MVYDILAKLSQSDSLRDKTLILKDNSIITGGKVTDITRAEIVYLGGESGNEVFTEPLENDIAIRHNERVVFKRKRHIEKVYPRG